MTFPDTMLALVVAASSLVQFFDFEVEDPGPDPSACAGAGSAPTMTSESKLTRNKIMRHTHTN